MDLAREYRLAIQAAIEASIVIKAIYSRGYEANQKADGSPVTEADLKASKIINQVLSISGHPVIDEETDKIPFEQRRKWKKCWCVDPLDGTKEFIKRNDEFAVNIALIENGKPVLGVIASPVNEDFIVGGPDLGVQYATFQDFINGANPAPIQRNTLMELLYIIASNSHHTPLLIDYLKKLSDAGLKTELIRKGSSLKFFDLSMNQAQIYPRFAPTMEWDIAAGQAILEGIGGGVFDVNTKLPLSYNKENLLNPHFIAVSDVNLSVWI
jgi:3'(2'), 5'-bisphosphate nucleotidase